jgi:hypothetical protein
MCAYGDDNCLNISDIILEEFNQISIAKGYEKLGMKYTDESKTGELVKYRLLNEISFLKRAFRFDEDLVRYVAPLDLDTTLEMTMWVRGDLDHDTRCSLNVEKAYGELAIHGKPIFDKWTGKIDGLVRTHLPFGPMLFDYMDYLGKDLERA